MVNQTLSIRRAIQEDASIIADLGARTFEASFGTQNRPKDMEQYLASSFSAEQIEAEIADPASTFLLAHEKGDVIGYAMLRDGKSPSSVNGPRPAELVRIYVEQEAIGRGYGSVLMNACLETAESNGNRTIWLGVWERNQQAIGFYEKWGFAKVGVKEFVLGSDLQTNLIMERSVEPDIPGVLAPPPVIYLPALLLGLVLDTVWPIGFVRGLVRYLLGGGLILVSGFIMPFVLRDFRRARTSFSLMQPSTAIITTGPFRYSRNPAYVALTLLWVGLGVVLDNPWILVLLLPSVVLVHFGVVRREERYLERRFGEEYRRYKASVRRWL